MATARSRRCSTCDIDWPLNWTQCKKCDGETWLNDDAPLTWEQTNALVKRIEEDATNEAMRRDAFEKTRQEFEDYYAERAVKQFRAELEAL